MPQLQINLKLFQDRFLFSQTRFPAMISGVGTGKSYMLLLKIRKFCEDYPNTLALIVRKEYTDLRDSTVKDFETYFNVTVDSNKEFAFPNGSKIMFRHAAELNVLKNINLTIVGIEQAEEFEDETQFIFLRDRLRRDNAPYQQLCVIANANGHNWIWKLWIATPKEIKHLDSPTANEFINGDYHATTATTFDNEENLPPKFMEDRRKLKDEAPNHYNQFVMNSFEETGADDVLMNARLVYQSSKLVFPYFGAQGRILAIDVARFGEDENVASCIEKVSDVNFIHIHQEAWRDKATTETTGKVMDLKKLLRADLIIIDDTGIGGGVTDQLKELNANPNSLQKFKVMPFIGNASAANPAYFNARSEGFFQLKEMIDRGQLKLIDDFLLSEQLLSIKYKFKSNGQKAIISKDEMRKHGLRSPDRADALMMACAYKDAVVRGAVNNLTGNQVEFCNQAQEPYDPFKQRN